MTYKCAHIIKRKKQWALRKNGSRRAMRLYEDKDVAANDGLKLMKQGYDLIIHDADGAVEFYLLAENIK